MTIKCPLSNSDNIELEQTIKTDLLINEWKKSDIDVSRFFYKLTEISLYKCLDTNFEFFYPLNLEGDNQFYKDLQKFSWYYMDWKWEHDMAAERIKPSDLVLEIGCGKGGFLERIRQKGVSCVGLEMNRDAMETARVQATNDMAKRLGF